LKDKGERIEEKEFLIRPEVERVVREHPRPFVE